MDCRGKRELLERMSHTGLIESSLFAMDWHRQEHSHRDVNQIQRQPIGDSQVSLVVQKGPAEGSHRIHKGFIKDSQTACSGSA